MVSTVSTAMGTTTWEKIFGGSGNDSGNSVQQTSDGGYIIAGYTESYGAGGQDAWLIKTDANGNKLWDKTFGGSSNDWAISVQQTSDGGYIIAGGTESYGAGGQDAWLIKTDANGNKLWDKTFGGSKLDRATCVQQTSDGGYIVAGYTESYGAGGLDAWLIKTDANGNKLWDKTFGEEADDRAASVQQTSDGGYILAGRKTIPYQGQEAWLIKTNSDGREIWNYGYGISIGDWASSVQQTSDGGYVLAGGSRKRPMLATTDSDGNRRVFREYGDRGDELGEQNYANSVQQTSDGGYILAGVSLLESHTLSNYGQMINYASLIKTDASGEGYELWDKMIGDSNHQHGASSVRQTSDGGYILAGWTAPSNAGVKDVWLIKTDANGNVSQ
jgi:predicted secreted protein